MASISKTIIKSIQIKRLPREYQYPVLSYIDKVEHPALFLEMRLGKTFVTARKISSFPVLIVAPYSALLSWEEELIKENVPRSEIAYLYDRNGILNAFKRSFHLINNDGFRVLSEISNYGYKEIILDESTFIKAPKTKITRYFCDNFRNVKRRWVLTGTPAPESELDYFQQLKFLNSQILPYKTYWDFRASLFYQPYKYTWRLSNYGKNVLSAKLSKYCYFLSRKDAGIDCDKVYEKRIIKLPNTVRLSYKFLEDKFILKFNEEIKEVTEYTIVQFNLLRRLCGGIYDNEVRHKKKINEILTLLKGELKNSQVVVWCSFIDEINHLSEHLTKNKISNLKIYGDVLINRRIEAQRQFKEGKCQVLICQPECFRHGVNLSSADTMVYYSLPLGLETFMQSQDRCIDFTKNRAVLILFLLCENTIDEGIYKGLQMKKSRKEIVELCVKRLQNRKD